MNSNEYRLKFRNKCIEYFEKNPFFTKNIDDLNKILEQIFSRKETSMEDFVKSLQLKDLYTEMILYVIGKTYNSNNYEANKIILGTIILILASNKTNKNNNDVNKTKEILLNKIFILSDSLSSEIITYFKLLTDILTMIILNFCVLPALISADIVDVSLDALFVQKSDVIIGRISYENEHFHENFLGQEIGLINRKYDKRKLLFPVFTRLTKLNDNLKLKNISIKDLKLSFQEEEIKEFITGFVDNCFDLDKILDYLLDEKIQVNISQIKEL